MSITHSPTQTFPELRLARRECSGDDQRSCASSDDDYDDDYGDYDDDDDDDDYNMSHSIVNANLYKDV